MRPVRVTVHRSPPPFHPTESHPERWRRIRDLPLDTVPVGAFKIPQSGGVLLVRCVHRGRRITSFAHRTPNPERSQHRDHAREPQIARVHPGATLMHRISVHSRQSPPWRRRSPANSRGIDDEFMRQHFLKNSNASFRAKRPGNGINAFMRPKEYTVPPCQTGCESPPGIRRR